MFSTWKSAREMRLITVYVWVKTEFVFHCWQNRIFLISPKWNRLRVIRWYVFHYHKHMDLSRKMHYAELGINGHVVIMNQEPVNTPKRLSLHKILKSTQKKTAKKHPNQQSVPLHELILWVPLPKERMTFNDVINMTHSLWVIGLNVWMT